MEWSDEVRKAVDDLEEKYGIEVVSSEHNERIHKALLDSRAENKSLNEQLNEFKRLSEIGESLGGELEEREKRMELEAENKKLRDALDYYATFDQNAVALRALKDK